jgi:predicted small lipoprotein YifL
MTAEAPGERSLVLDRLRVAFALALFGGAAFALAACGRAGPLELPPGPALAPPGPTAQATPPAAPASSVDGPLAQGPSAHETAMKNGFDAYGNPVAPPGQKKSFLLDPLLQ